MKNAIKLALLFQGGMSLFSMFMWIIAEQMKLANGEPPDRWVWFSRMSLAVICFGIYGIIAAIEEGNGGEK